MVGQGDAHAVDLTVALPMVAEQTPDFGERHNLECAQRVFSAASDNLASKRTLAT